MNQKQIKYLDKLWSIAIKIKWHHQCLRCGKVENLSSHHIYSKAVNYCIRWDLDNGFCLCGECHSWGHLNFSDCWELVRRTVSELILEELEQKKRENKPPSYEETRSLLWEYIKLNEKIFRKEK